MSILIALLAAVGAAVITAVVAFFVLVFIFERTFSTDEGLGIVWLAGTVATVAAAVALSDTFMALL